MSKSDNKPPRFMIVLKDFQTDVQVQVGAPKMADFLKKLPAKDLKPRERFELERVIRYFEKQVKKAEKGLWAKDIKKAVEGEVMNRD